MIIFDKVSPIGKDFILLKKRKKYDMQSRHGALPFNDYRVITVTLYNEVFENEKKCLTDNNIVLLYLDENFFPIIRTYFRCC